MKTRAIIMAAGKGTRMKSRTPKVLHELCGRPMIEHVLDSVRGAGADEIAAIVSPELRPAIEALGIRCIVQDPQNGTGHAMQLAMAALEEIDGQVLVASGDMPLAPASLLRDVTAARASNGAPAALVSAHVTLPTNFGRVIRKNGHVAKIVENVDASESERAIDEVNTGIYCFDERSLRTHLRRLKPDNKQSELYLTDCIASIVADKGVVEAVVCEDARLVMGINNRVELAAARAVMQRRILEELMLSGVTIVDPSTTYVDAQVAAGNDTVVLPNTHLRGKTSIGSGCVIGPDSMLENAQVGDRAQVWYSIVRDSSIGSGVTVGPFAHIRMGAQVAEDARIGNFVELKKTVMGKGVKAQHLSYLGDAEIDAEANIGAGTITCNWDGKNKNKTKIGRKAFIGSNSSLVAPVTIGDDALTGAGSVVIRDVQAGERVAGNPAKPLKPKT
ncbi:MAG TPA: bifunctional UDP-N-acetylglucosamine diphosphorylase/glucosamine-1-phosphate N-acetyltransferase GlmU [Candidatus Eremiobacteraceae bacterium]|nr:bifunctional UDP-N-acetylglucosamine diphosphorylase/glucosamine-1-phosphate N-acetyltransferase GlmU [Candidatus Eremiobacteraceae bacterium]